MSASASIQRLARLLDEFRKFDSELPIQHAAAFLAVSSNEGLTQKRLAQEVKLSRSSADRFCARFSQRGWPKGKPGLGLIEVLAGPEDARERHMYLTPKGRHVIKALVDLMDDQVGK